MSRRISQRLELILEDPKIGQRCKVTKMDDLEEQQFVVHTMLDVNFERMFLVMENHLDHLAELLAIGENININQRKQNEVGGPYSSSSSNRVPFKGEAKVDIPTFGGEVDAKKLNNWRFISKFKVL